MNETIRKLISHFLNSKIQKIEPIKIGVSSRNYFRVYSKSNSYIVSIVPHDQKNEYYNFLKIHRILQKNSIPVPKILTNNDKLFFTLQEDLGLMSIQGFASKSSNYKKINTVYQKIIDLIINIQEIKIDTKVLSERSFNYKNIMNEYKRLIEPYLIINFLKIDNLTLKRKIKKYYSDLAKTISSQKMFFCHRDFQSSNIFLSKTKQISIIDFQGARLALPLYDLVSIIECNYVNLSPKVKTNLQNYYFSKNKKLCMSQIKFNELYNLTLIQRKLHDAAIFAKLFLDSKSKTYYKYLINCLEVINSKEKNIFKLD
ncbi:MAG: phosphotransferase [Patescibacteria group bacterium]